MSSRTIYLCDRCGGEETGGGPVPPPEPMLKLRRIGVYLDGSPALSGRMIREQEWCWTCRELFGLVMPEERQQVKMEGREVPEPPSLEMLVRQIVRDEIQAGSE